MKEKLVCFSAALLILIPLLAAEAQDVDVPGNLTMTNSTSTEGNILKSGVPFLHNFGTDNTFLGASAGNLTITGTGNTAIGAKALRNGMLSRENTAIGAFALQNNMSGDFNTAVGYGALMTTPYGHSNTAIGHEALRDNTMGNQNTATGERALSNNDNGVTNTATGTLALSSNTDGFGNTATGVGALANNTIGHFNTAIGVSAFLANTLGNNNTAIGALADVALPNLVNATAIGAGAVVDAGNKIRLGNHDVTVIEGEVGFTASSDRNKKENLLPVDGEAVLGKVRELSLCSWNFIGQNPKQFRHYGPMAQDFFAAFGHDAVGAIGTETTITTTDIEGILMIAAQALEKRTMGQREEIDALRAENAGLRSRLEALERKE